MTTEQLRLWQSEFGDAYAERTGNRVTAENSRRLHRDWGKILAHVVDPAPRSVLEVGCNVGRNLHALANFVETLYGIEPNVSAVAAARQALHGPGIHVLAGDAFGLPFESATIDLVFTSGVLIHIAPDDLGRATDEIHRVACTYIACIEYFSHAPECVPYRGLDGYLFKRDFGSFYLDRYSDLAVVDYGFLWQPFDSADNCTWWVFRKGG